MNTERKIEIDKLLSNFFFGCNIPFSVVESSHFVALLRALNKNYVPPTRKTLGTKLLNMQYEEMCNSIQNDEEQDAVLLLDGWKNSSANSKNIVAMLHMTCGQNIFLESWNFNEIKETGEALCEVVNQCTAIAKEKYNVNIYAIVTDNAANMISIRRRVHLWHVTCNSHSGNLLFKSLMNSNLDDKVNNIIREFKSPNLESQMLSRGGKRMVLSAETRWCSKRDAYRRCLENISIMRDIINYNETLDTEEKYKFKNEVIETVFEESLEAELTNSLIIFDPLCTLVNACQKIDSNIADATEMWLKLEFPTSNEEFDVALRARLAKVINQYGLAANFLHQMYRGERFKNNIQYMNMMTDFFKSILCEAATEQLEQYTNGSGIFEKLFRKRFKSPNIFWTTAEPFCPQLSIIARRLLSIPASTGELERLFSQWTLVHCTKRNRLTADKSSKLIGLYYSLKLQDSVLYDDIDD